MPPGSPRHRANEKMVRHNRRPSTPALQGAKSLDPHRAIYWPASAWRRIHHHLQ